MSSRGPRLRSGPVLPSRSLSVLLLLLLVAAGCARIPLVEAGGDPAEDRLDLALRQLEEGRFDASASNLRRLAATCESGRWGASAVLVLAAVEVDPRNPGAHPDAAARLSARYLQIPGVSARSRVLARSLYLAALDVGAAAVEEPFGPIPRVGADDEGPEAVAGFWRVADRFGECGSGSRERSVLVELPEHPGTPLWRLHLRLADERDSLAFSVDTVSANRDSLVRAASFRARELQTRVDSLAAELERIRGLLEDGLTPSPVPPDPR